MNARDRAAHMQSVEMMKKISDAINNPGRDKIKTLLKVLGYIQREFKKPLFTETKMYPDINQQYLAKMVDFARFDIDKVIADIPKIDNPRQYVKRISITSDPYIVITNFMKSNMIPINAMDDDTLDKWAVINSSNFEMNFTKIKNLLDSIVGRNKLEILKDASKYIGIIVVVFGTILMNYIICMIGLGLIAVNITLDEYMKESSDDSVLSSKNYPYIINGTYPMIHVDREMEYKDIGEQDSESFSANNLATLIRSIGKYIDSCALDIMRVGNAGSASTDCEILNKVSSIFLKNHECTMAQADDISVYKIKETILNISQDVIDHDFKMGKIDRFLWCKRFLSVIENNTITLSNWSVNTITLADVGTLVQMFEILCLQIWDAFITQNHVRKIIAQENQYLTVNSTEDTFGVVQYYNTLQPLNLVPSVSNSQLIVNNMLESIGSAVTILTEAQDQNPGKEMDQTMAEFRKTVAEAKGYMDQFKNKALPWIKSNDFSIVENKFFDEDKAELKMYSFNPKNVASGINLLNELVAALGDSYASKRGASNVNDIIIKNFPTMANMNQNTPIPAEKLENIIGTGNADQKVKEEAVVGTSLQRTYKTLSNYIKSPEVLDFMGTDIVDKLASVVGGFKVKAARVAKQPQPVKESVDDIMSMFEADEANQVPTLNQPDSNVQKPQQPTQNSGQPSSINQTETKTNVNEIADAKYLRHAVTTASTVINTLISMTLEAYKVAAAYNQKSVKDRQITK